ncbi:tyrosine-type recombinase/integrase [Bacillus sp. FJAT-28004]|uniref:tyrosine-type recombinase/integrase n=1 Tax=Bacillus sp. FJAT-28004 TaxID=1679165 RepID=UPI0006B671D5|nr:tyrosine-type recombinase/integrase [Bacillus sp. FJAT-28004]
MGRSKKFTGVYERNDTTGQKSFYFLVSTINPETGKRKQKKYGGYKDAESAYKDFIAFKNSQIKGTYVEASKMTLKVWLEKWIGEKELTLKKVTLQSYRQRIQHINEHLGMLQLATLTKDIFTGLHRKLLERETALSSRTIHDTLKVLKMAMLQAYRDEKILKDITAAYKLPAAISKPHQILMPEEMYTLLDAAHGDPQYCAIYLGINTGMREAEILGLTWDAVDFENRTIQVVQTLNQLDRENPIHHGTKTHASRRAVEIDDEIIEVLEAQKRAIERDKKYAESLYQDFNLVCPTRIGTPVNPSNLRRSLDRLTKKAKVTRVTFHELRHTHATHLMIAGVDSKIVASRLGHSSTRVTNDIYQHVRKGMQLDALKKYRDNINPKKITSK